MANPHPQRSPATEFQPGNQAARIHGATPRWSEQKHPQRDRLTVEEQGIWDGVQVPAGASPELAAEFRMAVVLQCRALEWFRNNPKAGNPRSLAGLERMMRLLDNSIARIQTLFVDEAKVRVVGELEQRERVLREYMRSLTPEQLNDAIAGGSLPALPAAQNPFA